MPDAPHTPVLVDEVLHLLRPAPGERILDGTVGAGGHAERLLDAAEGSQLVGLDVDPDALEIAAFRLARFGERVVLIKLPYDEAPKLLPAARDPVPGGAGRGPFDAILLDIGPSSMQFDKATRGFSFLRDGPLDMRMDPENSRTAADLVNRLDEGSLADLIYEFGEERRARRIAKAIVSARRRSPIRRTLELAAIVRRAGGRERRIDPATRTFQALRIAVNDELARLERFLRAVPDLLAPGGRVAIIAFHSLEDRLVKQAFRDEEASGRLIRLVEKPIEATDEEVAANPRARSAKLRAARRAP